MKKSLIILRSVSGAGKSTFAEYIKHISNGMTVVCCADDFFTDRWGEYKFDVSKLGQAHKECKEKAERAMGDDVPTVVIANTNTANMDMRSYEDMAKKYGYRVFHVVIENRHGGVDVHGVPRDVKLNQEKKLMGSIVLC